MLNYLSLNSRLKHNGIAQRGRGAEGSQRRKNQSLDLDSGAIRALKLVYLEVGFASLVREKAKEQRENF